MIHIHAIASCDGEDCEKTLPISLIAFNAEWQDGNNLIFVVDQESVNNGWAIAERHNGAAFCSECIKKHGFPKEW
jgi:hypothetical protein